MSAVAHVPDPSHASVSELKAHFRRCGCVVEGRRTQAIWLLLEGRRRAEVMAITTLGEESLRKLVLAYNAHGVTALKDGRHTNPGAKTVFTDQELLLLARMLRDAAEHGTPMPARDVIAFVQREFGKTVHLARIYEVFSAVGITKQSVRPRHALADEAEQEAFKKSSPTWSRQLQRVVAQLNSGRRTSIVSA